MSGPVCAQTAEEGAGEIGQSRNGQQNDLLPSEMKPKKRNRLIHIKFYEEKLSKGRDKKKPKANPRTRVLDQSVKEQQMSNYTEIILYLCSRIFILALKNVF